MRLVMNLGIGLALIAISMAINTTGSRVLAQGQETNHDPRFTLVGLTVAENSQISYPMVAVDDDTQDSIGIYSITGGTDESLFSISDAGLLTATFVPDFENPQDHNQDNKYLLEIHVTSGGLDRARSGMTDFTITVKNVRAERTGSGNQEEGANNDPRFALLGLTVLENSRISYQMVAVDDDLQDEINGYDITGGWSEWELFSMNEAGLLTAAFVPNFEDPQDYNEDNKYELEIWVSSGGLPRERGEVADFTITVEDVDGERPGPVTNLRVASENLECVRFNWNLPFVNEGPSIDGYRFQSWTTDGSNAQEVTSGSTTGLFSEICGLQSGQSVRYHVRAHNAEGEGDRSYIDARADDCGANSQSACDMQLVTNEFGRINVQPDQDWFRVSLSANTRYLIEVTGNSAQTVFGGTLYDPAVAIFDSTGAAISGAEDNDGGDQFNARLFFTPTTSGTYYIQVAENGDDSSGTYTVSALDVPNNLDPKIYFGGLNLSVAETDVVEHQVYADDYDPSDSITRYELRGDDSEHFTISSAGYLTSAICTNFEVPADADADNVYEFAVWVFSGDGNRERSASINAAVTVTDRENELPDPPTNVRITDEGRTTLRFAWDAATVNEGSSVTGYVQESEQDGGGVIVYGTGNNAALFIEIPGLTPDTPTSVRVKAANADGYGCPSAWAEGRTDDCGTDGNSACSLSIGESQEGRINLSRQRDKDWYQIDLTAGAQYRIDVKGNIASDPGGTLPNPRVRMIDGDENNIAGAYNNNGGDGKNARLDFTPDTTGTHYVSVDSKNRGGVGTYTVSVTDLSDTNP